MSFCYLCAFINFAQPIVCEYDPRFLCLRQGYPNDYSVGYFAQTEPSVSQSAQYHAQVCWLIPLLTAGHQRATQSYCLKSCQSLDIGQGGTFEVIVVDAIQPPSGKFLAVYRKAVAANDRLTDEPDSHHKLDSLGFTRQFQCLYKHQLCKPCF